MLSRSIIKSLVRMNITTQSVWVMFEEYIWKNEFSEFKFKNIMMIIYAYAKNDKGTNIHLFLRLR